MRSPRLRASAAAAALAAGVLFAACAPPPRPAPAVDVLEARYRAARDLREERLRALTADILVRVDGRATGRLPGLPATLALAAPDRARLRVLAFFGTAADVCARGDSVWAWVPSQRLAVSLAGAGETLGVAPPAELLARSLGATWDPPPAAWRVATADSAGLRLGWRARGDSLAMIVDRDGRPAEVTLSGTAGTVSVRYTGWTREAGTEWPERFEIEDATGWARVRIAVEQLRIADRPGDDWFTLRVPDDARRLDWEGLREWLGRRKEAR